LMMAMSVIERLADTDLRVHINMIASQVRCLMTERPRCRVPPGESVRSWARTFGRLDLAKFLLNGKLHLALRSHDWASFARGYNGPNFAINQYDKRLNAEFQKINAAGVPDLLVRAAQLYLTYLGFDPHGIDGVAGTRTHSALAQFQQKRGLPITDSIDATTVTQLVSALSVAAMGATGA
jgi:N-acetylmuramidase/Putative peptidoglycan binding domain